MFRVKSRFGKCYLVGSIQWLHRLTNKQQKNEWFFVRTSFFLNLFCIDQKFFEYWMQFWWRCIYFALKSAICVCMCVCVSWIGGFKNNHVVTLYCILCSIAHNWNKIWMYQFICIFGCWTFSTTKPTHFHWNGNRYGTTFNPRKMFSGRMNNKIIRCTKFRWNIGILVTGFRIQSILAK